MKHRALIIDDDEAIQDAVGDIVASHGHEYDCAAHIEEARSQLEQREYTYVLLDLDIPVRDGSSLSRTENGQNLLTEIRSRPGTKDTPVIVMTAHGCDGPHLGVQQMKLGATDFIPKPFKDGTLDKAIREAVAKRRRPESGAVAVMEAKPIGPAKRFEGGMLVIYEKHAELCGVTIAEASRRGHAWRILQLLAEKNDAENYCTYSGEKLATQLGRRATQNNVAQCIAALRKRISDFMREQLNVDCGKRDVVLSGGSGYRLNPWIEVRHGSEPGTSAHDDPDAESGNNADDTGDMIGDTGVNERQKWILDQLHDGVQLRRTDVEQHFGCSEKTAKRDLGDLRERGQIEFWPKLWPGHYRMKSTQNQADSRTISAN